MDKKERKVTKTVNEKGEITIHIEGIGKITERGKLDLEGLIKDLLKNKYIPGDK